MSATFADALATRQGRWVFANEVEGWGRRIGNTGAYDPAYRLATEHPYRLGWAQADCRAYHACLQGPIHSVGQSIDLRSGSTTLGTLTLSLSDKPFWDYYAGVDPGEGWSDTPITDLLAVHGPAHSSHSATDGRWVLASAMDATQVTMTLDDATGISVGDMLYLEREAMRVSSIAGAPTLGVSRGYYNTEGAAHAIISDYGEGVVYDRPRFVRGRRVKVYAYLVDPATGRLIDEDERRLIWHGTIDDWSYGCGGTIDLACKPNLGRLDRCVGRNVINGTAVPLWSSDSPQGEVLISIPNDGLGTPTDWDYPVDASTRTFYARWGDELVLGVVADTEGANVCELAGRGLLNTSTEHKATNAAGPSEAFRDVLTSLPEPFSFFVDDDGDTTTHPIDILLSLITSTGVGTNGDWDCLPANWGAAFPVAEVNLETFQALKTRSGDMSFPRLMLGWDGKPTPLRAWVTKQILGPMGWFLYEGVGADGDTGLSIGTISDVYPADVVATIDEGDVVDGSWTMMGQLPETLSTQTFRFDLDLASGEYLRTVILRRPEVLVRYPDDDSEISYDVSGVASDDLAASAMEGRAYNFAAWFSTPMPVVEFMLRLSRIEATVTEKVELTIPDAPNPFTGERGLDAVTAIVLGAHPDFEGGDRCGIKMRCMLIPPRNTGLWSPAGIVRSYTAGAPIVLTLEEDVFTNGIAADSIPERDALAFVLADELMLLDRDGTVLSTARTALVNAAPETDGDNTLRLNRAFQDGSGDIVPKPGMIITYCHWPSGGTPGPTADWSATMKYTVAQADDADSLLPDGDPPYVYGN